MIQKIIKEIAIIGKKSYQKTIITMTIIKVTMTTTISIA